MTDVKLICFDLGRVLLRLCDGWQHALEQAGHGGLTLAELDAGARAVIGEAVCRLEVNDHDLASFAAACAPVLGVAPPVVEAITSAYILGPYPGALELLDALAASGVQTACLSNTNAHHWDLVADPTAAQHLPLDRLTFRFASHLIGARKPDEAAYAAVEAETGVPPSDIVFFDDLAGNVTAAERRGWRAHHVAHPGDPIAQIRERLRAYGLALP